MKKFGSKKHKNYSRLEPTYKEEAIRKKAYELWEADGSPEGNSEYYWFNAKKIVEVDFRSLPSQLKHILCQNLHRNRYIHLGIIYLIFGVFFLLEPIDSITPSLFSNYEFTEIKAYSKDGKRIENVKYEFTLSPFTTNIIPTSIVGNEDILVVVKTSLKRSANTKYVLDWVGKVRLNPIQELAEIKYRDKLESIDTDFLYPKVEERILNKTRIIINGLDSTPERDDYFMFIWINGKEKLGFSDRRIRLRISPITIIESIKISIDGTQQPIHTIPQPSGIEPDIEIGGIKYKYKGEKDIIFTYTDLNLRTRSQLRLLISGIFIGLLTNLMSEQFLERLKNIKEK